MSCRSLNVCEVPFAYIQPSRGDPFEHFEELLPAVYLAGLFCCGIIPQTSNPGKMMQGHRPKTRAYLLDFTHTLSLERVKDSSASLIWSTLYCMHVRKLRKRSMKGRENCIDSMFSS